MVFLEFLYRRYGRLRAGLWITLISFGVICITGLFLLKELVFRAKVAKLADAGASATEVLDWLFPWMQAYAGLLIALAGVLIWFGLVVPVVRRREQLEADLSQAAPREKVEFLAHKREQLLEQLDAALDDNLAMRDRLEEQGQARDIERDRLHALIRGSADRLLLLDREARAIVASSSMSAMLAVRSNDIPGRPASELLSLFDASKERPKEYALNSLIGDAIARASTIPVLHEVLLVDQSGRERRVMLGVEAIVSRQGRVSGALVRIDSQEEHAENAQQGGGGSGHLDTTTGLPVREQFDSRLAELISIAQNQQVTHSLILVQVDNLQPVYDEMGYWAGEELLWNVATIIRDQVGPSLELFRITAMHFALLLPFENESAAQTLAERVRLAVDGHQFRWRESDYRSSLSLAIAPVEAGVSSGSTLMEQADADLRVARDLGGNRVQTHVADELVMQTREIERQLLAWLDGDDEDSRLHLQSRALAPLRESAGQSMIYAMLRVEMQDGFWIDPVAFLSSAGNHGLMTKIDTWLIRRSLEAFASDPANARDFSRLIVPVGGDSVVDEHFGDEIEGIVAASGVPGDTLVLAVDESVCRSRRSAVTRLMHRLESLNIRLAIANARASAVPETVAALRPELLLLHSSVCQRAGDKLTDLELGYLRSMGRQLEFKLATVEPPSPDKLHDLQAAGLDIAAKADAGLGPIF